MPSATAAPGAAHAALSSSFNAYRILSLPAPFASSSSSSSTPTTLSASTIKAAYRRALLKHHPDKLSASTTPATSSPSLPEHGQQTRRQNAGGKAAGKNYTVDDVTLAYKTLLDPAARAAHDRSLRLNSKPSLTATGEGEDEDEEEEQWRLGLEAVDLDDLAYDEDGKDEASEDGGGGGGRWWRGCRCGEDKGFLVDEAALEQAAAAVGTGIGEVLLWEMGDCDCVRESELVREG